MGRLTPIALAALCGVSVPALAAEVEARKDGVEVYSDATNKSDVLDKMKSGDTLPATERKGMFWQVQLKGGKTGFVSIMAVKHKADSNTDLAKAIKTAVKEGRGEDDAGENRARSAVMGVRGLQDDDDAGNAGNVRPNLRAVFSMEDRAVKKKDLDHLGESVLQEIAAKSEGDGEGH
jgi:hypothetical protein